MTVHRTLPTRRRPCPTSAKMSFSTRAEAAAFNKRVRDVGHASLRIYLCTCSSWHLTHLTKREHNTAAGRAA